MQYKFWPQKEIEILKELYPKVMAKDLVKFFPARTRGTLIVKAKSLNLHSPKLWRLDEIEILREYFYEAEEKKFLRFLPRRSWKAILAKGERLGFRRKLNKPTLDLNENYFKKWSSNMAYILGFILSDGCIVKPKRKGHSDSLKFGVYFKDVDILEKIKRSLKSKHKISRSADAFHLSIASQIIVDDLKSLGVTYRKSLSEHVPKIPKVFIRDFIRGFVDGDGSVKIDKSGYPNLAIYGGEQIIKFIRDNFLKSFDIYSKMLRLTNNGQGKYLYQIAYRCNSAQALLDYLYKDSKLFLDRKYNLVKKCLIIDIKHKKNYTERELKIIKHYYLLKPKEELLNLLPQRKWESIRKKAWGLGLFKYQRRRNAISNS